MRARRGLLAASCMVRNAHPGIARAFSSRPTEAETIAGQPSLGDLLADARARPFIGRETGMQARAVRGVIVEMAVVFLDERRNPLAEIRWRAGEGTSFRRLRMEN